MLSPGQVILSIKDLVTSFETDDGRITVLDSINFDLHHGETLGLVGESGCGKSVAALSIMRLLPKPSGRIDNGTIIYNGKDLLSLTSEQMHSIRGKKMP